MCCIHNWDVNFLINKLSLIKHFRLFLPKLRISKLLKSLTRVSNMVPKGSSVHVKFGMHSNFVHYTQMLTHSNLVVYFSFNIAVTARKVINHKGSDM